MLSSLPRFLSLIGLFLTLAVHAENEGSWQDLCSQYLLPEAQGVNTKRDDQWAHEVREQMLRHIIGQDRAVRQLVDSLSGARARIGNPRRPFLKVLFPGPTGVGKTESVKRLVTSLGGDPDINLITIEGGEFIEGHKISKLVGSAHGYEGSKDKTPLFDPTNIERATLTIPDGRGGQMKIVFILFDEIEKAHPAVYDVFLNILDYGRVSMADNRHTNLRHAFIIGTTNLGAKDAVEIINIKKEGNSKRSSLSETDLDLTGRVDSDLLDKIRSAQQGAIKQHFREEFMGRWDDIIYFDFLTPAHFRQIFDVQLAGIVRNIVQRGISKPLPYLTEDLIAQLIRYGTDMLKGARSLEKTLKHNLITPLSMAMVTNQVTDGDIIKLYLSGNSIQNIEPTGDGEHIKLLEIGWQITHRGIPRGKILEVADAMYPGFGLKEVKFDVDPISVAAAIAAEPWSLEKALREESDVLKRLYLSAGQSQMMNVGELKNVATKVFKIGSSPDDSEYYIIQQMDKRFELSVYIDLPGAYREAFREDHIAFVNKSDVIKYLKNKPPEQK